MYQLKEYVYNRLVDYNAEVKRLYEGYIIANPEYHEKHHIESYRYLLKLRKYFNLGMQGALPLPPVGENRMKQETQNNTTTVLMSENNKDNQRIVVEDSDYELIKKSLYFDAKWYLKKYKDVDQKGIDPVEHYLTVGWREFRRPGPSFSTLLYLNRYADVSKAGINPLVHYERIGKVEKRLSSYKGLYNTISKEIGIIEKSKLFDSVWYQNKYLKDDVSCEKPSVHYFCIGCYWGYDPSAAFSSKLYKTEFPDLKNVPYLLHYETYSKSHGKGFFNLSAGYYENKSLFLKVMETTLAATLKMMSEPERTKVLLISHTLNLTGAPRVLFEMALVLKKQNFFPVIMTINEGPLINEIEKADIPVVISRNYEKTELFQNINQFAQNFEFMVFSTVEALKFAHVFQNTRAYKIAWVHEGNETLRHVSEKQKKRINLMDEIYTGSNYCNEFFAPYIEEGKKMSVLYYGVDDEDFQNVETKQEKSINEKIRFIIAGTIGYRKGHHILAEVISDLPMEISKKLEWWIVGSIIDQNVGEDIYKLAEEHSEIKLFGQVENERLIELISAADVLLCPSIDDPLPVVVTDALILSKPVVVTNMVGTSHFIRDGYNGFVIESGSVNALKEVVNKIVREKLDLNEIGKNGRSIYEENLSYVAFEKNVLRIFDRIKVKQPKPQQCRTITNKVEFLDVQITSDCYQFMFSCDINNKLCILNEGVVYTEKNINRRNLECLDTYLLQEYKRVAVIEVEKTCLLGSRLMIASQVMDTIEVAVGDYTWISLNHLAQKDFCIWFNENVLSFITKKEYYHKVINNPIIPESEKKIIRQAAAIKEYKYNLYCETRDNMNDNAYSLFLYDLKFNKNAYFLTTKSNFDKEKNADIKEHLLVLNTPEAKKYMMYAKRIVCSWYAPPLYGYKKMLHLYPFLNLNYIFVPHGISYDKDSYYLNRIVWGKYTETICCSDLEKDYFEECNGYRNVKVLGYPRMDKWVTHNCESNEILVFPSWRDEVDEKYIDTILEVCKTIRECKPEMKVIYLAHPSIEKKDYINIKRRLLKISDEIVIGSCDEREIFNKYFSEAKYLLTDYSSVAYDFAYRNGIAMYYEPFIDKNVHYHTNDLFEKHNCGIRCWCMNDVLQVINGNFDGEMLQGRVNSFFKYQDGNNTQRVYDEILKNA